MYRCNICNCLNEKNFCLMCNKPIKDDKNLGMGSDKTSNIARNNRENCILQREHHFDLHDYCFRFNINSHNFRAGTPIKMGNWTQYNTEYKGYKLQVNTKSILIYTKDRHNTTDPVSEEHNITVLLTEIVKEFAEINNITIISSPIPIRKEVKIKDFCMNENFRTTNFKSVYPIPSPVEFTSPSRAVKDSVKFISEVDRLNDNFLRFSEQLMIHLEVLDQMKNTLKAIENTNKKPTLLTKIKRLFNV